MIGGQLNDKNFMGWKNHWFFASIKNAASSWWGFEEASPISNFLISQKHFYVISVSFYVILAILCLFGPTFVPFWRFFVPSCLACFTLTRKKCLNSRSVWPDVYFTIQSLATYNNDNLPRSIKMPKLVQKFAKF